ncbi:MAG: DUF4391 domain-containing protein [Oscillospiraceae bacterium]|nr:DUF4391 domain-containing protein [Oscillospiraceae bacterium]
MLHLPKTTEFNRRIPKQKFYENLSVTPALKRVFVEQIKTIWWRNKIAASTMNLAAGGAVMELEVFELQLSQPSLDEAVLKLIDKEIPYHILFLLSCEGKVQAWIGYKEAAGSGAAAFKVNRYYHTDWLDADKLELKAEGLSLDAVYESFVRQIAGDALTGGQEESLKESVEREQKRQELEKKIAALQAKIRKEKQLNRQMELNAELKELRKEVSPYRR